jgi:hypothetical protein
MLREVLVWPVIATGLGYKESLPCSHSSVAVNFLERPIALWSS